MARQAKPYEKDGWYCTSVGGKPHQKLCRVEEGLQAAKDKLDELKGDIVKARRGGGHTAVAALLSPRPSVSVEDAIRAFERHLEANEKREGNTRWYKDKLAALRGRYGDWPLGSVTDLEVAEYRRWLKDEKAWRRKKAGAPKRGLSPTTVNMHLRAARAFFRWCYRPSGRKRFGLAADAFNPCEELKFLEGKERTRLVTDEEMKALLANCRDGSARGGSDDLREQLLLLRHTAMRPQELRRLKWDYVDWGPESPRAVFPAEVVKTGRVREVPLIDEALEVLKGRKERLEGLGLKLAGRYVFALAAKVDGVLTAGAGARMRSAGLLAKRFRCVVDRCVKKGLVKEPAEGEEGERLVLYHLRHTRGTEMFEEGNEQSVVQQAMGHATPMMTEKYKHLAGSWVSQKVRQRAAAARAARQ